MAKTSRSGKTGPGCLMLFALPFAGVGIGMTWYCFHTVAQHNAVQAWVEVPAQILKADLEVNHDDDGTTYRATAEYDYEFGGRQYKGDRVSLIGGADNVGSFQKDAHKELSQHARDRTPFRCYVNPQDPGDAILYRDLRWEMLTFFTLFGTLFGTVGLALFIGAFQSAWNARKLAARTATTDESNNASHDESPRQAKRLRSTQSSGLPMLLILTAYWNLASWPLVDTMPGIFRTAGSWFVWLSLFFPLVGLILVATLAGQFARTLRARAAQAAGDF